MMRWIAAHRVEAVALFCIICATLYSLLAPRVERAELDGAVGELVTIVGTVSAEPDVREQATLLTVRTEVGTVLVRTEPYSAVAYGDLVRVTGVVEIPRVFDTDTGRTFNYPMYLYAQGITHTMRAATVLREGSGYGTPLIAHLLALKHWFERGIAAALPDPESALLAGLLLGEKRGLGPELTESFRRAGIVHIVVLSGYNIALVISTVRDLLSRILPRIAAISSAGSVAVLFMLMTGASETAVRATLMALVVLLAQALYRPADALRILFVVAALMAVWNPYLVLYDLSYQLSILATWGLISLSHRIVPYLSALRSKTLIDTLSSTLGTQLAVLPLLIFSIGQVSIVALVSNILVLIAVPYAMLFGFGASLVAQVSTTAALPLTAVAYGLLRYIIEVGATLGALPFAALNL